jgi:hypothetical protein
MDKPSSSDVIHPAVATLLSVLDQSANDFRRFHDVIANATIADAPPFPRIALTAAERVVKNLKNVEEDLRKVMLALGLSA